MRCFGLPKTAAPPVADSQPERRRPSGITDDELVAALEANGWRYEPTARSLGIARNTLMRMIDKSGRVRRLRDIAPHEIEAALAEADGDIARAAAALGVPARALKGHLPRPT